MTILHDLHPLSDPTVSVFQCCEEHELQVELLADALEKFEEGMSNETKPQTT